MLRGTDAKISLVSLRRPYFPMNTEVARPVLSRAQTSERRLCHVHMDMSAVVLDACHSLQSHQDSSRSLWDLKRYLVELSNISKSLEENSSTAKHAQDLNIEMLLLSMVLQFKVGPLKEAVELAQGVKDICNHHGHRIQCWPHAFAASFASKILEKASQFDPGIPPAEPNVEPWWDEQDRDPAQSLYSLLAQSSGIDNPIHHTLPNHIS